MRYAAFICFCALAGAQTPENQAKPGQSAGTPAPKEATPPAKEAPQAKEEKPIETKHSISVGGKTLAYTATVGTMPIKTSESGEVEAHMFYIAYTLDQPKGAAPRPLTFSFNGGP